MRQKECKVWLKVKDFTAENINWTLFMQYVYLAIGFWETKYA